MISVSAPERRSRRRCSSSFIDGATMNTTTPPGKPPRPSAAPSVPMSGSPSRPPPGPSRARSLKILHLRAHLLDQALRCERRLTDLEVVGLRGDRVDLAVQLLDQEVERPTHGPALGEHERALLEVRAEPGELLAHVGLLRPDRHLAEDPRLVDRRLAEERAEKTDV